MVDLAHYDVKRRYKVPTSPIILLVYMHIYDPYLAPESEVLNFGLEVTNVSDLRSIFTESKEAETDCSNL